MSQWRGPVTVTCHCNLPLFGPKDQWTTSWVIYIGYGGEMTTREGTCLSGRVGWVKDREGYPDEGMPTGGVGRVRDCRIDRRPVSSRTGYAVGVELKSASRTWQDGLSTSQLNESFRFFFFLLLRFLSLPPLPFSFFLWFLTGDLYNSSWGRNPNSVSTHDCPR